MPQKVDPFIPIGPRPPRRRKPIPPISESPKQQLPPPRTIGNDFLVPTSSATKKPPALDQLRPWKQTPQPRANIPKQRREQTKVQTRPIAPRPAPEPTQTEPATQPRKNRKRWLLPLRIVAGGILIFASGLLLQTSVFGELLIAVYGVVAVIKHIESRTTFLLAFISVGCIVLLLLIRPDVEMMQNFAIYAFLFLLIGTISAAAESRY